jgi:hypothetical protein
MRRTRRMLALIICVQSGRRVGLNWAESNGLVHMGTTTTPRPALRNMTYWQGQQTLESAPRRGLRLAVIPLYPRLGRDVMKR